ncbi:DUF948 domain-containing protein [Oceanobacillus halotolerans]|uniref:DUF948 domain-containing protein n=1 Tax=Oceanobacillus halotolerans TaxID=2663380 RepID=UPI0013DBDAB0|nr:DUF948 domain-containing protein [Oceanobacillus halotolerans]
MEVVYLASLLIAIAFAIITGYIIVTLRRVTSMMTTVSKSLSKTERQLQYITPELKQSVRETSSIIDEMEDNLQHTDDVFNTLENTGEALHHINQLSQDKMNELAQELKTNRADSLLKSVVWSEAAYLLYSKWKKNEK